MRRALSNLALTGALAAGSGFVWNLWAQGYHSALDGCPYDQPGNRSGALLGLGLMVLAALITGCVRRRQGADLRQTTVSAVRTAILVGGVLIVLALFFGASLGCQH
jgi:hypothetical protein